MTWVFEIQAFDGWDVEVIFSDIFVYFIAGFRVKLDLFDQFSDGCAVLRRSGVIMILLAV